MSASASKKRRKGEELTAESPKQLALQKEREHKKKTIKTVLISAVAVIAAAAVVTGAVIYASRPSYDVKASVATVGDYTVTVPMFNYYYAEAVNTFTSQYGSILSYVLDTSKSLDSQYYDEENGQTWGDYFETQAENSISMNYNIYDYALKDGYTLTEEDNTTIDEAVENLKSSAKTYGLSADKYLEAVYGEGCNLDSYREYCTVRQVVASYYTLCEPGFASTADEVDAKYAEDPNAVDAVTYLTYTVNASSFMPKEETSDDTAETTAATTAEITDDARELAKQAADEAVAEFPTDEASSASNNATSVTSSISEEAATWLFAAARKDGDTKVFASEDGNTLRVLCYKSRDTHEYNLVDAYVINIPYDTESTETTETETETQTALEKYNTVCAALTDDMTDEDFTTLGTTYGSSFSGVTSDIKQGNYADEVNTWLFDASRKAGDTQSFDTGSNYYVIRFSKIHEQSYKYELSETLLYNEKYDAWYEKVTAALSITMNEELRKYINSDLTLTSSSNTTT